MFVRTCSACSPNAICHGCAQPSAAARHLLYGGDQLQWEQLACAAAGAAGTAANFPNSASPRCMREPASHCHADMAKPRARRASAMAWRSCPWTGAAAAAATRRQRCWHCWRACCSWSTRARCTACCSRTCAGCRRRACATLRAPLSSRRAAAARMRALATVACVHAEQMHLSGMQACCAKPASVLSRYARTSKHVRPQWAEARIYGAAGGRMIQVRTHLCGVRSGCWLVRREPASQGRGRASVNASRALSDGRCCGRLLRLRRGAPPMLEAARR